MGTFSVSLQVGDIAGQQFIEVDALVDTGSTYTVLPSETLDRLGVQPEGHRQIELGDDRLIEYRIGYARLRFDGNETIGLVVFGPESTTPLLGATTLENFSLGVDPGSLQLIPVPALLK